MSWLSKFLRDFFKDRDAISMTLVKDIAVPGAAWNGAPIVTDKCYIEIYVESLRLQKTQRLLTSFHGAVYAFVRIARLNAPTAQLAVVSKPSELAKLDGDSLEKVIPVSKKLVGATPWRGGDLGIELGLFSVKSGNLLSPILEFVSSVSTAAGASFVTKAEPFLPLITKGMDLLTGQTNDTSLEVGEDTNIRLSQGCAYAIVATPKGSLTPSDLTIDKMDGRLLSKGREVNQSYCVFSIRPVMEKADYGEIPDVKKAYDIFLDALRNGRQPEAKEALTTFNRITLTSPDLIEDDAINLGRKAKAKLDLIFGGGLTSSTDAKKIDPTETLGDIGLYRG